MERKKTTVGTVPASHVKNNFGEVLRRVYEHEETLIVERAGLPVAAIVPIGDLERLYPEEIGQLPEVGSSLRRQEAARRLRALLNRPGSEQYSEAEVEVDVRKAVDQVRYGKRRG